MPSYRAAVLAATLAFAGSVASIPFSPSELITLPSLNALAQKQGKLWFGTAADIPGPEQQDEDYMALLRDTLIFGEITPANYMKFEYTEPEQNVFNYTGGDVVLDLAERTGKRVRCHNLIWVSQLPDWVTNGNWTAESLTAVMKNHIFSLITHWGDRCYSWDVVNEALASDGTFASSIWYDTIGSEYFFLAYQYAQEAVEQTGRDIKLFYNDYGIENPGVKANATYALVQELQSRHIRIDGIGLESHFEVGLTPSTADQAAAQQGYLALGLDVAVTELDVRFTAAPFYTEAAQAQQAADYYSSVAACVQTGPRCIGITVWDFDDEYSWVPSTFPGNGGADLFNNTLQPKPAYFSVAEALENKS